MGRYDRKGMNRLMVGIIRQAVFELNFGYMPEVRSADAHNRRSLQAVRCDAMEAAMWLAGTAPDWFEMLGIPMPMEKYHDWIDQRVEQWENLSS